MDPDKGVLSDLEGTRPPPRTQKEEGRGRVGR